METPSEKLDIQLQEVEEKIEYLSQACEDLLSSPFHNQAKYGKKLDETWSNAYKSLQTLEGFYRGKVASIKNQMLDLPSYESLEQEIKYLEEVLKTMEEK